MVTRLVRSERWIDVGGEELQQLRAMRDELVALRPLLHLTVYPTAMRDRGDEPAVLHRFLAELGYVPELLDESNGTERWVFKHPDGTDWDAVGLRHGTDKSSAGHGYLRQYESLFGDHDVHCAVEVGVDEGRSLLTWMDLWPDAEVWGVEINGEARVRNVSRYPFMVFGDATKHQTIGRLPKRDWDLVVDDGSHQFNDQAATMSLLAPLLGARGVYVVEDVPWSDDTVSCADVERVVAVMADCGLRPLGVAWSLLRHHLAVIGERRP